MFKIDLSTSEYETFLRICNSSPIEISGAIMLNQTANGYTFSQILLDREDSLDKQTSKHIVHNDNSYVSRHMRLINTNTDLFVQFHTHPGDAAACYPSKSDIEYIKGTQDSIRLSREKGLTKASIACECIITKDDIMFYYIPDGTEEVKYVPLYVDGVEKKISQSVLRTMEDRKKGGIFGHFLSGIRSGIESSRGPRK